MRYNTLPLTVFI